MAAPAPLPVLQPVSLTRFESVDIQTGPRRARRAAPMDCVTFSRAAAGFFSRRLGVKGQSSPQDVACGMFIGLRRYDRNVGEQIPLG